MRSLQVSSVVFLKQWMFPYQLQEILIYFGKYRIFSVSDEVIPDQSGVYTVVIDVGGFFDIRIGNKGYPDLFGNHLLHGMIAVHIAAGQRKKMVLPKQLICQIAKGGTFVRQDKTGSLEMGYDFIHGQSLSGSKTR